MSLLTELVVIEIYASNESGVKVADRLNISTTTVSNIRRKKTWRYLTQDFPERGSEMLIVYLKERFGVGDDFFYKAEGF